MFSSMDLKKELYHAYDSFLNLFLKKEKKQYTYVSLGDSTVQGLGATNQQRTYPGIIYGALQETHKNAVWHNLGRQEFRVCDVINERLDKAISLNPDLITISVGANDIRYRTRARKFENDLATLLTRLKKETTAQIVMNNIPDFSLTPAVPKNLKSYTKLAVWRFNRIITNQTQKADVVLVDLHLLSKIYAKNYPETIAPDGFHPTDFGYAIWANTILGQIQEIVFKKKKRAFRRISL
jgi:acyl-CoA thioesterase-1